MELFIFKKILKNLFRKTKKKSWPTKIFSHISVTREWLKIYFCTYRKSPLSKKSRFLAEYRRTHLWKCLFVPQRKEKTKVETFSNSKKLLPAIPLD